MKFKLLLLFLMPVAVIAQVPVGQWQAHVPMSSFQWIGETQTHIYAANSYGILAYDREEGSTESLTKVNVLSQTNITSFKCNASKNICVIGYSDGNMDILSEDNTITNQPAILNSDALGDKGIYDFQFDQDNLWIAGGIGVLLMDISKGYILESTPVRFQGQTRPIKRIYKHGSKLILGTPNAILETEISTLFIQPQFNLLSLPVDPSRINQFFEFDDQLYAIYRTPLFLEDTLFALSGSAFAPSPRLAGMGIRHASVTQNTLIITHSTSIIRYTTSFTSEATIFTYGPSGYDGQQCIPSVYSDKLLVADGQFGGIVTSFENQYNATIFSQNSPRSGIVSQLGSIGNDIYALPGGTEYTYNRPIIQRLHDHAWQTTEIINSTYPDYVNANHLAQSGDEIVVGSDRGGVAILDQALSLQVVYSSQNSPLSDLREGYDYHGVTGLDTDEEGHVYISYTKNTKPLKFLLEDQTWVEIQFPDLELQQPSTGKLIVLENGYIAMIINHTGVLIYDHNNTPADVADDRYKLLKTSESDGNIPSNQVTSLAQDNAQELWIGTDQGIGIVYSPESVFDPSFAGAEKPIVQQDGYNAYLFETEVVQAIAVDGANRKWIGTSNSGLYLISEDGREQLRHFTQATSPLFSDRILDLTIHPEQGTVFIATEQGLVSYRSDATAGTSTLDSVRIFPNPVKAGFSGQIAISNLPADSHVRITSASGHLLYQTISKGGQATWNGRDLTNQRVQSGVYLVHIATADGSAGTTQKIFFLN